VKRQLEPIVRTTSSATNRNASRNTVTPTLPMRPPSLRAATSVFARSAIAEACRGSRDGAAGRQLRSLVESGSLAEGATRSEALGSLSAWLSKNYRDESIYKNAVANNILFGRHSPATTAMLQEFRVRRSKVDCVIVNGSVHAYEIKTELDSPARLAKQLADYRTVFPKISVITDERLAGRYAELLDGSPVGVVALSRGRSRLSVKREAAWDGTGLDVEALMRSLTKPEYTRLVAAATGAVPDAPSGVYFAQCLNAVRHLGPVEIHQLWADELRRRRLRAADELTAGCMRPIRHVCVDINPDAPQARQLRQWLEEPAA
jgi:hypothetical protein